MFCIVRRESIVFTAKWMLCFKWCEVLDVLTLIIQCILTSLEHLLIDEPLIPADSIPYI